MPDPITPRDWDQLPNGLTWQVGEPLDQALARLATEVYGAAPDAVTAREQGPACERDFHLAQIAASAILTDYLQALAKQSATSAGQVQGAPATYTALGAAAGITKEGARGRWPFAIPNPKRGRPKKEQVTVALQGGHPQWDGKELSLDRDSVYGCDLDDVGGYLLIPDGSAPDHLEAGVDWRAHYAPESEDTRTTWMFQGWVPS